MASLFHRQLPFSQGFNAFWKASHIARRLPVHLLQAPSSSLTPASPRRGAPHTRAEDELIQLQRHSKVPFAKNAAELGLPALYSVSKRSYAFHKNPGDPSYKRSQLPQRKWEEPERAALIELYNAGETVGDIARALGRSSDSVVYGVNVARTTGIIRPRVKQARPLTSTEYAQIVAWRRDRVHWKDIAGRLDRSLSGVYKLYMRFNEIHSPGFPWTAAETAELIRLKQAGLPYKDIGKVLKRSAAASCRMMARVKRRAKVEDDRQQTATFQIEEKK